MPVDTVGFRNGADGEEGAAARRAAAQAPGSGQEWADSVR